MKSRHLCLVFAAIILAVVGLYFFSMNQKLASPIETSGKATSRDEINSLPDATASNAKTEQTVGEPLITKLPRVEMAQVAHATDMPAKAGSSENLPFKFFGNDAVGRVVDQNGRVLIESGKEIGILGVAVSPNQQMVLVEGGDAVNFVLTPSTGSKIKLPVYPPGANMLGFGAWHWISENKLLGESGVQALNAKGAPMNCCEGHNVAQTKLYVYDVTTQKLAEVTMPSKATQPVVNVVDVSSDGHVHLVHEVPHVGTQQDLGWFKIDAPK